MQPTDHMSTAVEYSCGETNKHSGSPQEHIVDSLSGKVLRWTGYCMRVSVCVCDLL